MIIGIDLGTSAVKIVALSGDRVLASASSPLFTASPKPGWSEQAPADWWRAVRSALAGLRREVPLSDARAVGLSGQMHGAVLLDDGNEVLRPAILWNDGRAAGECETLAQRLPDIGRLAGVPPLPGFTAPKLLWVAREEPQVHERVDRVLLPKDWIGFRLHGETVTDRSDAAGTLWLDQARRVWSDDLAAASATDPAWLPPLLDGTSVAGRVTREAAEATGLPQGIPVAAGGGDAATGAVAMGATVADRGFVSLGTSGQLFVATDAYRPNPGKFVHAFAHTVPDRWYNMAAMLNGARPIAWLAGQFGVAPSEIVTLAEKADPARVPLFLPYLTGERSPHGDPHIRGAFYGLEDSTGREVLARSVVEAIAFSFADAAQSFGETLAGVDRLAAIGGGTKSDFLLGLISTMVRLPIERTESADAGPAVGAARLAQVALGDLSVDDLASAPPMTRRFEPGEVGAMGERLDRFRALYAALRDFARPR